MKSKARRFSKLSKGNPTERWDDARKKKAEIREWNEYFKTVILQTFLVENLSESQEHGTIKAGTITPCPS